MKNYIVYVIPFAISFFLMTSCASSVSQEEYDRVSNELSAVQSQLASLENKLAECESKQAEYDELVQRYETLDSEYKKLQAKYDSMQPNGSTKFPRILTQEEQDRVKEIALNSKEMVDLLKTRTTKSIELIWSGNPASLGHWGYEAFEKGELGKGAVWPECQFA